MGNISSCNHNNVELRKECGNDKNKAYVRKGSYNCIFGDLRSQTAIMYCVDRSKEWKIVCYKNFGDTWGQ